MSFFVEQHKNIFTLNPAMFAEGHRMLEDGTPVTVLAYHDLCAGIILVPTNNCASKYFNPMATVEITLHHVDNKTHVSQWDVLHYVNREMLYGKNPATYAQPLDCGFAYKPPKSGNGTIDITIVREVHDLLKACILGGSFMSLRMNNPNPDIQEGDPLLWSDFCFTIYSKQFEVVAKTAIDIKTQNNWFYFKPHLLCSAPAEDGAPAVKITTEQTDLGKRLRSGLHEVMREYDESIRQEKARIEAERLKAEEEARKNEIHSKATAFVEKYNLLAREDWHNNDKRVFACSEDMTTVHNAIVDNTYRRGSEFILSIANRLSTPVNNQQLKPRALHNLVNSRAGFNFVNEALYLTRIVNINENDQPKMVGFIATLRRDKHFIIQVFSLTELLNLKGVDTRFFKLDNSWPYSANPNDLVMGLFERVYVKRPIGYNGLTLQRANDLTSRVYHKLQLILKPDSSIQNAVFYQEDVMSVDEYITINLPLNKDNP